MGAQCCTPADDYLSNADDYAYIDEWYPGDALCVVEPFMTNDQQLSPVRMPKGLNLIVSKVSHDRIAVRAYGAGNSEIWEVRKTYIIDQKDFDKLDIPHDDTDSLERKESIGEPRQARRRTPTRQKPKQILSPSEIADRVKKREIVWQTMVEDYQKKKGGSKTKVNWVDPAGEKASSKKALPPKQSKKLSKRRRRLEDVEFGHDNEGVLYEQCRVLNEHERIVVKKFDGDRQKWGVKVNLGDDLSEWRVLDLQAAGQFASKGVQVGWRFLKINNFHFKEENRSMVEIILKEHQKCRITFLDDTGSVIDEEPAPPAPVGEVLHTHEEDFDQDGFVEEDDFENIPEEDSDAAEVSVSVEEQLSPSSNILNSPPAPDSPVGSLGDPHKKYKPSKKPRPKWRPADSDNQFDDKWQPAGSPLPDRPETPAVVDPPDVVHSSSENISIDDHEHQGFELGDEFDIIFESKPFGFSIIEDEYGENAYIDGIQKDWLEEQGLRMNAQVIEIDSVDVVSMQYGDIIDTMRAAQLPCMLRFKYSIGPDLPPEEDQQWEEEEYEDRSDSYQKYDDEGSEGFASPHTSDMLPDELAEFEEIVPDKDQYREPSSSGRYSPRRRESSTSPLPDVSGRSNDSPRESAFERGLNLFAAGSNDAKVQKDTVIVPKHKRKAFSKGIAMFENTEEEPKKKKKRKSGKKKRAAFAHALALFQQNDAEEEKGPTKKKSGRRRKGKKKKDLTEDSGDENPSWARKEGESKKKIKKGFKENAI